MSCTVVNWERRNWLIQICIAAFSGETKSKFMTKLGAFHKMYAATYPYFHVYRWLIYQWFVYMLPLNTLRPRQNGRHFPDDIFKCIFWNENIWISIKISPKFVPKGPIIIIPAFVQIMAWRLQGDKPLSEPMLVSFLTHICVIRPQWVNNANMVAEFHDFRTRICECYIEVINSEIDNKRPPVR